MASPEFSIVNETDYLPYSINHFSISQSGNNTSAESFGKPPSKMFVRLPFTCETKWHELKSVLSLDVSSIEDLKYILNETGTTCDLDILKDSLFELQTRSQGSGLDDTENFLDGTLRLMQKAVLEMPRIFPKGLPKLGNRNSEDNFIHSVTLTRWELLSLIAAAFFNLYDGQSAGFTLVNLMSTSFEKKDRSSRKEKLKCFLNYFCRFSESSDQDLRVTFLRKCTPKNRIPVWATSKRQLPNIRAFTSKIEDNEYQSTLVDFANKHFGGGVLSCGTVQEEIMICEYPECVVGVLLCEERLDENEALLIVGPKKVNEAVGYGSSFKWSGTSNSIKNEQDPIYNRYKTSIVAIDALNINLTQSLNEYSDKSINREVLKAYTGFKTTSEVAPPVATGKWGCGVFGGSVQMKVMQQIVAAAESQREVHFHFFEDSQCSQNDVFFRKMTCQWLKPVLTGFNRTIPDS